MTDAERQKLLEMLQRIQNWPSNSIIPVTFQMSQVIKFVDEMMAERVKYK